MNRNGLRFDRYGIAYGKAPLFAPGAQIDPAKPFTILIEVRPHAEPSDLLARILSVCDDEGRELFFLGQWKARIALGILDGERFHRPRYRETRALNLAKDISRSVAVCSDGAKLTLSIAGDRAGSGASVDSPLPASHRTPARLVLGNSPAGKTPWRGEIFSLSIFATALTASQIAAREIAPVLRYSFSERSGNVCRGSNDPRRDLLIPSVFRPPAKAILVPPWRVERLDRSFWEDVFVNILGFIPFGFAVYAWLGKDGEHQTASVTLAVVLLGLGISLFIELLQVYLPTRDSSLTDVANNTLGTYIGALLFRKGHRSLSA